MKLFFDKACLVSHTLYFTTSNTSYLFRCDLRERKIKVVAKLLVKARLVNKFAAIIHHDGVLWMIPENFLGLLSYNIETERQEYYESCEVGACRDAVCIDSTIYALSKDGNCMVLFDLIKKEYRLFDNWGVERCERALSKNILFSAMMVKDRKIYFSAVDSLYSIILDVDTFETEVWEQRRDEPLNYMWRMSYLKNSVFLMPFSGLKLYKINGDNRECEISFENIEQDTLSPRKGFSARQILEYDEKTQIVISYLGNVFLIMDNDKNIIDCVKIEYEEELQENEKVDFLNSIIIKKREWKRTGKVLLRENIGKTIWHALT